MLVLFVGAQAMWQGKLLGMLEKVLSHLGQMYRGIKDIERYG